MDNYHHFRLLVPVPIHDAARQIEIIKYAAMEYLPKNSHYTCQLVDCLNAGRHLLISGSLVENNVPQLELLASHLRNKAIKGSIIIEIYQVKVMRL